MSWLDNGLARAGRELEDQAAAAARVFSLATRAAPQPDESTQCSFLEHIVLSLSTSLGVVCRQMKPLDFAAISLHLLAEFNTLELANSNHYNDSHT
jgi:hypothetical protein